MKDSFKTMSALVIVKEGSPSLLNEKKKMQNSAFISVI